MIQLPQEIKQEIEKFSSVPSWSCIIKDTDAYTAVSLTTETGIMWSIIRDIDSQELKKIKFAMLTKYINMSLLKAEK